VEVLPPTHTYAKCNNFQNKEQEEFCAMGISFVIKELASILPFFDGIPVLKVRAIDAKTASSIS
jgi:hypothetical protein